MNLIILEDSLNENNLTKETAQPLTYANAYRLADPVSICQAGLTHPHPLPAL